MKLDGFSCSVDKTLNSKTSETVISMKSSSFKAFRKYVCLPTVRFVYKIFYIRSALLSNDRKCARADLSPVSIRNHAFVPHSHTHGIKSARTSRFLQNRFFQVHTSSLCICELVFFCVLV